MWGGSVSFGLLNVPVKPYSAVPRKGKVFVDWSQNDQHKTTVAVYSLRAHAHPTASTPLHRDEIEAGATAADPASLAFNAAEVIERAAKHGDPFAPVLELEQELPNLG